MALPKSSVKIRRDGVEFVSNVDRAKYLLVELQRAALRDTAKLIRKRLIQKLKQLRGMRQNRRLYRSSQYWVRRRETDLQIGFKHGAWYGAKSDYNQGDILRETVLENIDDIQRIQGQYLSAIEDENKAIGLIDTNGDPYYSKGESEND